MKTQKCDLNLQYAVGNTKMSICYVSLWSPGVQSISIDYVLSLSFERPRPRAAAKRPIRVGRCGAALKSVLQRLFDIQSWHVFDQIIYGFDLLEKGLKMFQR